MVIGWFPRHLLERGIRPGAVFFHDILPLHVLRVCCAHTTARYHRQLHRAWPVLFHEKGVTVVPVQQGPAGHDPVDRVVKPWRVGVIGHSVVKWERKSTLLFISTAVAAQQEKVMEAHLDHQTISPSPVQIDGV